MTQYGRETDVKWNREASSSTVSEPSVTARRVISFSRAPKKQAEPGLPTTNRSQSGSNSVEQQLSKMLHEAQSERRRLLGRVATLQHRLREEALADAEAHLARMDEKKEKRLPEDDARENRVALTGVIAQIERIVDSSVQTDENAMAMPPIEQACLA